jgi:hypothetical protein
MKEQVMSKRFSEMSEEEKKNYFLDRANKWKHDHPEETRKLNREASRRKRKTKQWKSYYSTYFKEWRSNPVNFAAHGTRCVISALRYALKKNPDVAFKEDNIQLLNNLQKAGWSVDMDTSKRVLNHICSLHYLHTFNVNLPRSITCDYENLEICDKLNNNRRVKRTINQKVLDCAKRLETKFPEALKGFFEFMLSHKGEIR